MAGEVGEMPESDLQKYSIEIIPRSNLTIYIPLIKSCVRKFARNLQILETFCLPVGSGSSNLLVQLQSRNKGEISPWGHTKPTFEEIERKLSIEIAKED